MTEPTATTARFGRDPGPYYLALGVVVALELVRRAFLGFVPDDFTAYLVAADMFWEGLNPYTGFTEAQRWNGKPYNYFPGTLYLIVWMAWVPTAVAVTIDFVARITALFFAIRWLARRILPDTPTHLVFLVALACEPLFIDVLFGNFVSYLLSAWVACVYLAEQSPTWRRSLGAAACGLVFAFKPFWFAAAAYPFFLQRNWRGLGALVGGGAVVGALSLRHLDWKDEFFAHTQAMREFYYSVDFLNLAPPLLGVAVVAWVAGALYLDRHGDREWAWLFSCASLVIFPRLATYSYSLALPLVFFFIRRWGWGRGLLYGAVLIGPLPWLLRVSTLMPGERLENWTHFVWILITAVVLFVMLRRPQEDA